MNTGIYIAFRLFMNPDMVVHYGVDALKMVLMLSMPMLLVALVVGVLISLFQAVTQIQEMTLTFVPKIIAVFLILVLAAGWMIEKMVAYTQHIFNSIPSLLN
ncbi:MAG: flagellar biosynthesis protein FliQ [Mariprofundaceae bacterium]|nr:flagellar biosynthesis protein FliQ [Mariprofundaceae bacterium]